MLISKQNSAKSWNFLNYSLVNLLGGGGHKLGCRAILTALFSFMNVFLIEGSKLLRNRHKGESQGGDVANDVVYL